jgi:protein arginine kinase activator
MVFNHSSARRDPKPQAGKSKCGRCGMTLKKIHEHGRVGCSDDYDLFSEEFSRLFREMHGSDQHSGKIPGQSSPPSTHDILLSDLERLRKELSEVIKSENYELAAELRDKIKGIENEMSKLGAADQSKEQ